MLPFSLIGASIVAFIGYIISVAHSVKDLLYCLTSDATIVHSMVVLLQLLYHRRQLHELIGDVGRLEEATALCRRPDDHAFVQRQSATLAGISAFSISVWICGFFASAEIKHPNYPLKWSVPVSLQSPPWYHVALALQVLFCVIISTVQAIADVSLGCYIDSLTLFQKRLGRYFQEFVNDNAGKVFCLSEAGPRPQEIGKIGNELSSPGKWNQDEPNVHRLEEELNKPSALDSSMHIITDLSDEDLSRSSRVQSGRVQPVPQPGVLPAVRLEVAADLDSGLQMLTETYNSIQRLFQDSNTFCSLPILSLHAGATTTLLLGSYVSILMYHNSDTVSAQVYGFAIFTLVMVIRLLILSSTGSRLIQQGQQLHDTLAAVRWPRGVTTSARFSFQMLLERTRTPIAFEGWGLVTVQKGTMLSIFSFVLTYFVIMVQMKVA